MHILYSVITFTELSRFKEMIRKIDPNAFVVVSEILVVMGSELVINRTGDKFRQVG